MPTTSRDNQARDALLTDVLHSSPEAIAARLRWARRQGHPGYLWPDVSVAAWRAAVGTIAQATAAVLAGFPASLEGTTRESAHCLGVAAFSTGMGPLLGHWIYTGAVAASGPIRDLLQLHLEHGRRRATRLSSELDRALRLLHQAGVRATVLKSMHTAGAYFPEPGTRPCADIDLLITPRDIPAASQAFRSAGFRPGTRQRRPYKCDWIPLGTPRHLRSLHLTHADNPWTIELHDSLDRKFYGVRTVSLGRPDAEHLDRWPRASGDANVLAQPWLLSYLALHASEELHHLQLLRLVELVLVIQQDQAAGRLDWCAVRDLLTRTGGLRFAYPAFELAERLAPGTVDPSLRSTLAAAAPPRMRRIIAGMSPATALRLERVGLAERFMWAMTPSEFVRRALYSLWPTRDGTVRDALAAYRVRWYRLVRRRIGLDYHTRHGETDPPP